MSIFADDAFLYGSFYVKWSKKWKSQPTISDFPQIS